MSSTHDQRQVPTITELRLNGFKSFNKATLPLGKATVLLGRNSSGKSNALDGLEVLARLAEGEDFHDALDGTRREQGAIRGGSQGLPPHGQSEFSLGCSVSIGEGTVYSYDVTISVEPELRIRKERLVGPGQNVKQGNWASEVVLYEADAADDTHPGIGAKVFNGKRGTNPMHRFRDNRLILGQASTVMAGTNRAERSVLNAAAIVQDALRGVFHLDPVPHLMRDYVHQRDSLLRRAAQNISPMLKRMSETERAAFSRVESLVRHVGDEGIENVTFETTKFGEVMMALEEGAPDGGKELTSAREMSDGLLRFTAIAAALLSSEFGLDVDNEDLVQEDDQVGRPGVLLVIEELENGLHPSQAGRILDLVRESSERPGTSVLITTHSPALLDAAEGTLNDRVFVTHRDPGTRASVITPLAELPGYVSAMTEGNLGAAVTNDRLFSERDQETDYTDFNKLIGIA